MEVRCSRQGVARMGAGATGWGLRGKAGEAGCGRSGGLGEVSEALGAMGDLWDLYPGLRVKGLWGAATGSRQETM